MIERTLRDYVIVIVVAALVALGLRFFVIEGFRIPADSMMPGLRSGDHIFVNKLAYGFRYPSNGYATTDLKLPRRGDVVVHILNNDSNKDFIKRVIGLPGDKVAIKDQVLYLNGTKVSVLKEQKGSSKLYEERLDGRNYQVIWDDSSAASNQDMIEVTVPSQQLFLLGDSRTKGVDSRKWGFIPVASLKGQAWVIWLSLGDQAEGSGRIRWSRFLKKVE